MGYHSQTQPQQERERELCLEIRSFPPRQRRVRSVLSPRCAGAAARRAVLSPPHYLSGWCVSPAHISPHWDLGFFPKIPLKVLLCFLIFLGKFDSAISLMRQRGTNGIKPGTGRSNDPRFLQDMEIEIMLTHVLNKDKERTKTKKEQP